MIVSCLPVLGMGTGLAHMLRADAEAVDTPHGSVGQPGRMRPLSGRPETRPDQAADDRRLAGTGPRGGTRLLPGQDHKTTVGSPDLAHGRLDHRWIRPA